MVAGFFLSYVDQRASRRFVVQRLSIVTVSLAANTDRNWPREGSEWMCCNGDLVASPCKVPLRPGGSLLGGAPRLVHEPRADASVQYLPRIVLAHMMRGPQRDGPS